MRLKQAIGKPGAYNDEDELVEAMWQNLKCNRDQDLDEQQDKDPAEITERSENTIPGQRIEEEVGFGLNGKLCTRVGDSRRLLPKSACIQLANPLGPTLPPHLDAFTQQPQSHETSVQQQHQNQQQQQQEQKGDGNGDQQVRVQTHCERLIHETSNATSLNSNRDTALA